MLHLEVWQKIINRDYSNYSGVVLMDHGPLYRIARLLEFGPRFTGTACYPLWIDEMFQQWLSILDIVIWTDAPDPVLVKRINKRNEDHIVKGVDEQEAITFLNRYRSSYKQLISKMVNGQNCPLVLCINTNEKSVVHSVNEVLDVLQDRCLNDLQKEI